MLETVRQTAMFCVGRAVLFGCFGVSIVMLSFAFDGVLLFRSGSFMMLCIALVLLWFAQTVHSRPPKRTETWILLDEADRPYNPHAVKAFGETLKQVYAFYAYYAVLACIIMLAISLLLSFTGLNFGLGVIGQKGGHPAGFIPAMPGEP